MDLLIRNGMIVNAAAQIAADIVVNNGKITAIWIRDDDSIPRRYYNSDNHDLALIHSGFNQIIDATGLLVLPGAIDAHTHFELPFGDICSADDFYTGTRAAACGGATTVIDFAAHKPGESLMDAFNARNKIASSQACVDYGFHMTLSEATDAVLDEMEAVADAGVNSFKVFMTYDARLEDEDILRILRKAKTLDGLVMVHAEAHEMLEKLRADFAAKGKLDPWHHYLSRPESVEAAGVERAVHLAKKANAPMYIVHLACERGMNIIETAKDYGFEIYAETCPQYLYFTYDVYKRPDAHNFVCSPPIKGQSSQDALWRGIQDGSISTVATDHCPFTLSQKALSKDDFSKIPNGVMGVETFYPYMLSQASKGRITFNRAVELCCHNPANIFGYASAKGSIAIGRDADVVLFDPNAQTIVKQENMHSANDYTIWEDVKLQGCITHTISRGEFVYENGTFLGKKGRGLFLKSVSGENVTGGRFSCQVLPK